MRKPGATIDEHAVQAAGGRVLEGGEAIAIGGWVIESRSSHITADAEMELLKEQLHTLAAPEQFFGDNHLSLRHAASGVTLRFDALGALRGWLEDQSAPVQIEEAQQWQRSRQRDMQETGAQTLRYDWTFTTSYAGSLTRGQPAAQEPSGPPGAAATASGAALGPSGDSNGGGDPSPAAGAPAMGGAGAGAGVGAAAGVPLPSASPLQPRPQPLPQWAPTQEVMNRGLLMSRDPILYFVDLPLYESELEDHGSSSLSVKVRVMPRCWYVLLRFWLRVDHVMVRLREARLFCQFDSPAGAAVVLREVKHSEGKFEELRRGGAPPEGPAYADGDSASQALQAVAPVGVKLYRLEKLSLQ